MRLWILIFALLAFGCHDEATLEEAKDCCRLLLDEHPCDQVYVSADGELVPVLDGEDVTEYGGAVFRCEGNIVVVDL